MATTTAATAQTRRMRSDKSSAAFSVQNPKYTCTDAALDASFALTCMAKRMGKIKAIKLVNIIPPLHYDES
jgi:hypothetical protein